MANTVLTDQEGGAPGLVLMRFQDCDWMLFCVCVMLPHSLCQPSIFYIQSVLWCVMCYEVMWSNYDDFPNQTGSDFNPNTRCCRLFSPDTVRCAASDWADFCQRPQTNLQTALDAIRSHRRKCGAVRSQSSWWEEKRERESWRLIDSTQFLLVYLALWCTAREETNQKQSERSQSPETFQP